MRFTLGCELGYQTNDNATMILNIEAMGSPQQKIVAESFSINPFILADTHDATESSNRYRRMVAPPGSYTVRYEAQVDLMPRYDDPAGIAEVPISALPLEVLPYLYPSRYCQSDRLARFVNREFGQLPRGHGRVTAMCNWIYTQVDYLSGSSDSATSAYDTFSLRAGVCRDFAHLGITFCRALGIPARFVSAYGWQLTPQDFHAVFEAYLGDRWYLFDATRLCPLDGLVRIGIGRDAADTAFSTFYGIVTPQQMAISIERDVPRDPREDWTTRAVSVSQR